MMNYAELTDNQLQALAADGDTSAENELALRYIRLVKNCARPYFLAGGDSDDLTQEGMLGLLSVISHYSQNSNASLKTYAALCVRHRLICAVKSFLRV